MADSRIIVNKIQDKVTGREVTVDNLLFNDNGDIKTVGGNGSISIDNATKLNGETKEQLLSNVNATTIGGKTLSQIQSGSMYGPVKLLPDSTQADWYISMVVTEKEELLFCGANNSAHSTFTGGNMPSWISIPHPLKGKSKIKQLAVRTLTTYILYENGDLYGRGQNTANQLGNGNAANQFDWVKITDNVDKLYLGRAGYYSEGGSAAAVIKKDKSVWFWGTNAYGHAGLGNATTLTVPTKLPLTFLQAGDTVKDILLNDSYWTSAYIITEKGKLYACGANNNGQLGLNDKNNRSTFQLVSALQDKKVVNVTSSMSYNSSSTQYFYNVAVFSCSDNTHYVCGNIYDNIPAFRNATPTLVQDNMFPAGYKQAQDPIVRLEVHKIGACYALTRSGRLFACGHNGYGETGTGSSGDPLNFLEVKFADSTTAYKVKQFWVSNNNNQPQVSQLYVVVEINDTRYLYAAGYNAYGNLGINNTNNVNKLTLVPFDSASVDNIKQFNPNGYQNINNPKILLNDGRVYTCGYNANGACGLNHVVTPITRFVQTL